MTSPSLHWLQTATGRIQKQHLFLLLVFLILPNIVHATDCLVSPVLPCTFTLAEPFNGANWPTQPIDFRYDGGFAMVKTAKMVNSRGTELPFQWVSSCWDSTAIFGCIEIQDSLPSGATQTYTLEAGPPSVSATNPVVANNNVPCYSSGARCIQLTNGLTGVQVPTMASNGSSVSYHLAPIQGCGLPNGGWTCAIGGSGNPNLLYAESTSGSLANGDLALRTAMTTATGYTTKFVESGPLKTVLQLTYSFTRPDYFNGVAPKFYYGPTCTAATGTYADGYISWGGNSPPPNGTVKFNASNFCSLGAGSAPLDTTHYYTATAVPNVAGAFTLTTIVGGVVTPVIFNGSTVTGSPKTAFLINSATCSTYPTPCADGRQDEQPGRLVVTLTLYANAKSVQITTDSDMQYAAYYPFYNEITPDTARLRAPRGTATSDPRCGYLPPYTVTAAGTGATTATITSSTALSNGQFILLTGVGSGANLPNGVYYVQTTSPYSSTTPGVWTSWNGSTFSGATTAPGSYTSGGLVKVAAGNVQTSPIADTGFDYPWAYGDSGFTRADPWNGNFSQCIITSNHLSATPPLVVSYPPADYASVTAWVNYQAAGSGSSPVFGWYTGDASLMKMAAYSKMPGLYAAASGWISGWGQTTAIEDMNVIPATGIPLPTIDNWGSQKSWGLFADINSNLPAFSASTHPPVQDDMNTYTGVNLSHVYAYRANSFSTPAGGWKWLYMNNDNSTNAGQQMNCLIERVQSNSNCAGLFPDGRTATPAPGDSNAYYNILLKSAPDTASQTILKMWHTEATSPSTAVSAAITSSGCPSYMTYVGNVLAGGDNHFDTNLISYQVAFYDVSCFSIWNAILADSNSTTSQQAQMITEAGLLGGILWDNSWQPWDGGYYDNNGNFTPPAGDGAGLQNQQVLFAQDRATMVYQFGVNGANSFLASKVASATASTSNQLQTSIGCPGAVIGGTHYQTTYSSALIPNAMITAIQGSTSFANQCQYTQGYPNWFLATTTPPDPRYGNVRKKIASGDTTSEEGDPYPGLLATGLYTSNATVAGWMSWLWHQYGTNTFQYIDSGAPQLLQIDETIPQVTPTLTSQQIDGDFAVQRAGTQGGGQETALWFINGGYSPNKKQYYSLQGHRHYDDGNVSIFALGAPLSMDWGANLYEPDTLARFEHNAITFDGEIPSNGCAAGSGCIWSSNNPTFNVSGEELLASPTVTAFQAFGNSTQSTATFTYAVTSDTGGDGTVWTRAVRTMAPDPSYPIFYIKDTFAGGNGGGKTLTWNLEATGAVTTPAGAKTPRTAFSNGCWNGTGSYSLPSANDSSGLAPYSLANGLQEFTFSGFVWPQYAGTNLKWNLYERPTSGSAQFLVGNWGHGCGAGYELGQFQVANAGASWFQIGGGKYCVSGNTTPFCDWQHILRVHDTGPFETVITPTVASGTPPSVSYGNGVYSATFGSNESLTWNDSYSAFTNGVAQILTTYNSSAQSAFGMTASGGPQEIANNGAGTITWTIDDVNPGTRTLTLPPGAWYPSIPVQQSAGVYTYYHGGGAQPSPAIVTLTQTPVTLRSVPLNYSAPPGAAQVRVKFGSSTNYAAIAACNPLCSIVMQAPLGTWPEQHDFLDGNGNVLTSSQVRSVVIQ